MEENEKLEIERIVRESIRSGVERMLARPLAQPPCGGKCGRPITAGMKLEIGQMLREGVSDEGILLVMDEWQSSIEIDPHSVYAAFTEYGKPWIRFTEVVEGSLVEPITDPTKLLGESKA